MVDNRIIIIHVLPYVFLFETSAKCAGRTQGALIFTGYGPADTAMVPTPCIIPNFKIQELYASKNPAESAGFNFLEI